MLELYSHSVKFNKKERGVGACVYISSKMFNNSIPSGNLPKLDRLHMRCAIIKRLQFESQMKIISTLRFVDNSFTCHSQRWNFSIRSYLAICDAMIQERYHSIAKA